MAIVIGAATTVSFGDACVISANWGSSPNVQRLYCIGEWTPRSDLIFEKPVETLNFTIYAPGPLYSSQPTQSCADANTLQASIAPAACGEDFDALSGDWFVTSYSYSKDDELALLHNRLINKNNVDYEDFQIFRTNIKQIVDLVLLNKH